ncbi:MAG: site-2 protease family protein [Clostridiales bacterium]|nr:site-2 protease family protein [Clostridiales bacterium]
MVTAIVTIIMFLVMVSLHEFGHYIVARALNFKILEYAIGFGPVLLKSKKSEIQYSVRAIPLGGYCKFEGEDEDSDDPRAFSNQAVWKRMLVVMAGGVFNVILGFLLFLAIVPATSPIYTNTVDTVVENSYIADAGILPGDKIVEINGKNVSFYDDITLYTRDFSKDEEAAITVKRGGEKLDFTIRPTEQKIRITYLEDNIEYYDEINGHGSTKYIEYDEDTPKQEDKIGIPQESTRYIIGFTPKTEDVTFLNVWGEAWHETKFVVKLVYQSLWGMVTGKVGVSEMSGPVGIVKEVNNAVNQGSYSWLYVLNLIALLTINLGVFNLLPIPALDGGRLFFMLIELVRRKPIPPEKEGMVHAIGMLLLIGLIIFVSYNDIVKLFVK